MNICAKNRVSKDSFKFVNQAYDYYKYTVIKVERRWIISFCLDGDRKNKASLSFES